jgi:broad specificity phosphatase PhoE
MASIYLVRHGQASFGAADYDQLSSRGEEQSALLGQWLKHCGLPVNKVYLGEAKRHMQTAQHCLAVADDSSAVAWQILSGFNEFDHQQVLANYRPDLADVTAMAQFLSTTSNPRRAFQQLFGEAVTRWLSGQHDDEYSESWPQFQLRCFAALQQVISEADASRDLWVFTSGGTISAILQTLLGISNDKIFDLNWSLMNTGITKILFSGQRISVSYINNYAHLEQHRRAELLTYR